MDRIRHFCNFSNHFQSSFLVKEHNHHRVSKVSQQYGLKPLTSVRFDQRRSAVQTINHHNHHFDSKNVPRISSH